LDTNIETNLQEIFQGQVYVGHLENLTPIKEHKTTKPNIFTNTVSCVMKCKLVFVLLNKFKLHPGVDASPYEKAWSRAWSTELEIKALAMLLHLNNWFEIFNHNMFQ